MITVVVPTMWKFEPFPEFINTVAESPFVGEVIIIDNDTDNAPEFEFHEKVRHYYTESNIGCNPAWNFGVHLASYDKILIANDDIVYDLRLLEKLDDFISEEVGVVGLHPGTLVHDYQQIPFTDGNIDFVPWEYPDNPEESFKKRFGFGSLFAIHKTNWVKIPPGLKIYYGDDWVFETQMRVNHKWNYLITNLQHYTPWATTTKEIDSNAVHAVEKPIFQSNFDSVIACNLDMWNAVRTKTDINEHLGTLKRLARDCFRVTEMGVRDGQSTRAFLSEVVKLISYDIVLDDSVVKMFKDAQAAGRDVSYIQADTLNLEIEVTDMLFIDTDHTYEQLSQELAIHGNMATKYLVFHDTEAPYGSVLLPAVLHFMRDNPHWKVKEHYRNCHGLTVLERSPI